MPPAFIRWPELSYWPSPWSVKETGQCVFQALGVMCSRRNACSAMAQPERAGLLLHFAGELLLARGHPSGLAEPLARRAAHDPRGSAPRRAVLRTCRAFTPRIWAPRCFPLEKPKKRCPSRFLRFPRVASVHSRRARSPEPPLPRAITPRATAAGGAAVAMAAPPAPATEGSPQPEPHAPEPGPGSARRGREVSGAERAGKGLRPWGARGRRLVAPFPAGCSPAGLGPNLPAQGLPSRGYTAGSGEAGRCRRRIETRTGSLALAKETAWGCVVPAVLIPGLGVLSVPPQVLPESRALGRQGFLKRLGRLRPSRPQAAAVASASLPEPGLAGHQAPLGGCLREGPGHGLRQEGRRAGGSGGVFMAPCPLPDALGRAGQRGCAGRGKGPGASWVSLSAPAPCWCPGHSVASPDTSAPSLVQGVLPGTSEHRISSHKKVR